ncbi:DNA-binding transcriptional regulator, AcrR family [Halobacillus karajensis]|uniref:HTH-type transcriptional repressor KstR2 n=1 Tax=Halobacillus karajensis TaxID=195088 RepID=A0A024P375_9BACI|nr:TetR/AcrR family transcriptional regulator [Halobacillus karajensis]CDQ19612.1 HTH-type transcriptional repressor KstR2 [Halobacillus karajensis]CDQ22072.1 HTH-type transcriptional repressor KstR2 [Halobacillus karajensis]CDQ27913.1 HTH-type transcriptional repressor KstR2 [Halobacillus karajensis]SEH79535.1 DNA-binding transcriptional regulator, AcrR family [Halobacillus karajensis]
MSDLREKIIQTSLELFDRHGYHGVTVKQIVQATNTSKGGFYHHFQSKDELLFVIHDTFITYVLKEAQAANVTHSSPIPKVQAIIQSFVQVFDLYKPHISVFYQESLYLKPEYEEKIKKKRDEFKRMVFEVIDEGQQSGHFRRELPLEITGMAILGMVNWIYKWYRRDGNYSIDQIAEVFTDLVLHFLLPGKEDEAYFSHMLKVPFFYEIK